MADERDPQVSRRYRELGAEEPPPALDASILAAARRASARRSRWYLPLAAAAVAVLAVAVAVQVERQEPDPRTAPSAPQPRTHDDAAPAKPAETVSEPEAAKRAAPPELNREAPARQERRLRSQESAPAGSAAKVEAAENPERWLERIAELRKQGRQQEADQALAEFRQRYPGYRVPEAMQGRIEGK
jgi:hypothetical protein